MKLFRRLFPVIVSMSALFAVDGRAESIQHITIDSGFLSASVRTDFEPAFALSGHEFSITGGAPTPSAFFLPLPPATVAIPFTSDPRSCQFCLIGTGLSFALQLHGETFSQPRVPGPPQPPLYSGRFEFTSSIPREPGVTTGPGTFATTAPFTFSGGVTGRDPLTQSELFNLALDGGGTVTANFLGLGGGGFLELRSIRYDFEVIPEPSTILLVASGFGILAASRWLRKEREAIC